MTAATVSDVYAAAVLEAAGDQRISVVTDAFGIADALRDAPEAVDMLDHPALNRDQAKEMVACCIWRQSRRIDAELAQSAG